MCHLSIATNYCIDESTNKKLRQYNPNNLCLRKFHLMPWNNAVQVSDTTMLRNDLLSAT